MASTRLRAARRLSVIGASLALLLWVASFLAVVLWSTRDQARPVDAIVVMGAAQYVGRPSPVLRARLDHAYSLWQRELASRVILTGGRGPGDTTSEAAVSSRYLKGRGIPTEALLLETDGRSTRESMAAVAKMMRSHELRTVVLVSDPFHMLRLRLLAEWHGLDSFGSPTRSSPISARRTEVLTYLMGESVKVPLTAALTLVRRPD